MLNYKILTSRNCPKYDPHLSRLAKLLGWLGLVPRPRFVIMHAHKQIMWCNPDSVPSLTRLLDRQGHKYTVQPALAAVPRNMSEVKE